MLCLYFLISVSVPYTSSALALQEKQHVNISPTAAATLLLSLLAQYTIRHTLKTTHRMLQGRRGQLYYLKWMSVMSDRWLKVQLPFTKPGVLLHNPTLS